MADQQQQKHQAAAPEPGNHKALEPDTAADPSDGASVAGFSQLTESAASLRSTILEYRRENGRTYHRLSDGKYIYPNDAQEQDRLDMVHHLWSIVTDGAFCLCPMNEGGAARVLDLGTGTGAWALDYADKYPDSKVIGVDLSAIQPSYVPQNCSFEIDDLEKEWTWQPFNFIFCRNMIGSFASWDAAIKQAYDNLEPGGYFEIHDSDWPPTSDDGSLTEKHAFWKWAHLTTEGLTKIGRPINITATFDGIMRKVGFEEVKKTRIRFPISPWPKDPKFKDIGLWTQASVAPELEGMSLRLMTREYGWTKEETLALCAEVRKEFLDPSIHAYWNGYIIHGRKPLSAASKA